jgi:SAM-dependent methyltransferase
MNHTDHVELIRGGVEGAGTRWADLGSGSGAFTLALAEVLGDGATIYSVDRDEGALRRQAAAIGEGFPQIELVQLVADFEHALELPPLDGMLMANSLHFVRDKVPVLERLLAHLRPGGRFVLVEYDADRGNQWVPHPLSYRAWERLAAEVGLRETRRLASVPSRFLGSIYAALGVKPRRQTEHREPAGGVEEEGQPADAIAVDLHHL